jgi:hypothetical protein
MLLYVITYSINYRRNNKAAGNRNLAGSVRVLFVSEEALVALGTGVKNEGIWDIGIKNC